MRQGRTWGWSLEVKAMIFPAILPLKDATLTMMESTLEECTMEKGVQNRKGKHHL